MHLFLSLAYLWGVQNVREVCGGKHKQVILKLSKMKKFNGDSGLKVDKEDGKSEGPSSAVRCGEKSECQSRIIIDGPPLSPM